MGTLRNKRPVLYSIFVLILLQMARILLKQAGYIFLTRTTDHDTLLSVIAMLILTPLLVAAARRQSVPLLFLPDITTPGRKVLYAVFTALSLLLIGTSILISRNFSLWAVLLIIQSNVIVPVFEELIFRGYLWSIFTKKFDSELKCYLLTTVLFAVWHLGYVDSVSLRVPGGQLAYVMAMKAVTGLCFGVAAGFVRYRAKNCYASMLAHSVLNVFGR